MKGSKPTSLFSYETLTYAVAGSTGSVLAMTTFYPLDTVRSRLQLEDRESKKSWKVIQELVKEEGLETLYRGIVPVLKSLWVSNFVFFYTFHGLRYLSHSVAQTVGRDFLFASIAGIVNVLTTTPLWVVSTRLKMEGVNKKQNHRYNGLLDGLIKIKREEGIGALWSGTMPSLMLVLNPAINQMFYEFTKRKIQSLSPGIKLGSLSFFMIGAFSKTLAAILTYPLQLVQAKLRHGHNYENLRKDVRMMELLLYIFRKQGFMGLFKGMEAKILQTVLTSALMCVSYEKIAALVFLVMRNKNAMQLKK